MSEEKNKQEEIVSNCQENQNNKKSQCSFFETVLKNKNKINIDYNEIDFQKGESSPRYLLKKRKIDRLGDKIEKLDKVDKMNDKTVEESMTNQNQGDNNSNGPNSNNTQNVNLTNNLSNFQPALSYQNIPNEDKSKLILKYLHNNINKNIIIFKVSRTSNKIKSTYESYLDFVHDSYFSVDNTSSSINLNNNTEDSNNPYNQQTSTFRFSSLDLLVNPLRQKFIWETWSPYEIALFECCISKFNRNFDLYSRIIRTKTKDEIVNFYYYWKQSRYYKIWKNSKYRRIKNKP